MTTRQIDPLSLRPAFVYAGMAVFLASLAWIAVGCGATGEQATGMPTIEPAPLEFDGQIEFADGSVVSLQTGQFLVGGEGKKVDRIDFNLSGGVLADGSPHLMKVEYRSSLHGDWIRCGGVEFDVMGCTVLFSVPLHEQCGKADIGVMCQPFRVKTADAPTGTPD